MSTPPEWTFALLDFLPKSIANIVMAYGMASSVADELKDHVAAYLRWVTQKSLMYPVQNAENFQGFFFSLARKNPWKFYTPHPSVTNVRIRAYNRELYWQHEYRKDKNKELEMYMSSGQYMSETWTIMQPHDV
jgi:hypothetical protein